MVSSWIVIIQRCDPLEMGRPCLWWGVLMAGYFDVGGYRVKGVGVSSAGIKVDVAGNGRGITARPREAAAWLETESIFTIDHGM